MAFSGFILFWFLAGAFIVTSVVSFWFTAGKDCTFFKAFINDAYIGYAAFQAAKAIERATS